MDLESTIPFTDITLIQLITAIIILVVGWIVIKYLAKFIRRYIRKSPLPPLMEEFMGRIISVFLYVVLILVVLGTLGVDTGSAVLGLSAILGLVLSFGMQDTLNNFFAGVWIATLRPIAMGETVTVNGLTGKVDSVGIMSTVLITPDNTYITIPNKSVWGSPIVNSTRMPTRRAEVSVGTSYDGDINRAIQIAMDVMNSHPKVLEDPAPGVIVSELGDSSVNLSIRAWANTEDYWDVLFDLRKQIFGTYTKEGIEIPYPQMDVHMQKGG